MDPGAVQRFTGIDIADADDTSVVHDQVLDGLLALSANVPEIFSGEVCSQRFRPERSQAFRDDTLFPNRMQLEHAKPPRVTIAPGHAVIEIDYDVLMVNRRRRRGDNAAGTSHAQMHEDDEAAVELDKNVLGSATDVYDRGAADFRLLMNHDRRAQLCLTRLYGGDAATDKMRPQSVGDSFNFRKLWHGGSIRLSAPGSIGLDGMRSMACNMCHECFG